jgi:hypothetical protein
MKALFDNASQIIQAASATTLGVYVFCIFVTAVLVVLLFQGAPLLVQIGAFVATLLLMAVILVLIQKPPKPPSISGTGEWTHFASHSPEDIVAILNRASPDPGHVAANCTSGGDIHIWYQGEGSRTRYQFASLEWTPDPHPRVNFFHNDGTIVPIGWFTAKGDRFGYLEVLGPR